MFIKSRFIQILLSLLFVFLGSFSWGQSVSQALQQKLIQNGSSLSLLIKIENPEKQRYDVMVLKGLLKLIHQSEQFSGPAEYTLSFEDFNLKKVQINNGFLAGLFSSAEKDEGFKTAKQSKNIFVKSIGLDSREEEKIIESLITFVSVSAEEEHRKKYVPLSSMPSRENWRNPRYVGSVQRKIYFLVGHLQILDDNMHDYVLDKIQPYFKTIQDRGFEYIYVPYAGVSDLISALNSDDTLAIYWISHSLTLGKTKLPFVLDADKNLVPRELFTKSFRKTPVHLAMVACYPEKIAQTYSMDQIIEDRQMTSWYSQGANDILKQEVIRPVGFNDYLTSLPKIQRPQESLLKNYNKLTIETAGAFPLSNKFFILLNGRYISTVKYNDSAGYSKFSILIPKEYFQNQNRLTIRSESTPEQALRDSDLWLRHVLLSDEKGSVPLYENQGTYKIEKNAPLTLFTEDKAQAQVVEQSLDFNL